MLHVISFIPAEGLGQDVASRSTGEPQWGPEPRHCPVGLTQRSRVRALLSGELCTCPSARLTSDLTPGPGRRCPGWGAEHVADILPAGAGPRGAADSEPTCRAVTLAAGGPEGPRAPHVLTGPRGPVRTVCSEQWLSTMTDASQVPRPRGAAVELEGLPAW